MADTELYKNLQYHYEIFRSRLILKQHCLGFIVKDVYDNVGQLLTLVRVQLATMEINSEEFQQEKISESAGLVGVAIRSLLDMCKQLNSEPEFDTLDKLHATIDRLVNHISPGVSPEFITANTPIKKIGGNSSLILLATLLEILQLINRSKSRQIAEVKTQYTPDKAQVDIVYKGGLLNIRNGIGQHDPFALTIPDRIRLAGGGMTIKKIQPGQIKIKLVIPIN